MKKITWDEYQSRFEELQKTFDLDYFLDMDNPADQQYSIHFNLTCGLGMLNQNEDQVAAWLPDGEFVYIDTSISEVLKSIIKEYGFLTKVEELRIKREFPCL